MGHREHSGSLQGTGQRNLTMPSDFILHPSLPHGHCLGEGSQGDISIVKRLEAFNNIFGKLS